MRTGLDQKKIGRSLTVQVRQQEEELHGAEQWMKSTNLSESGHGEGRGRNEVRNRILRHFRSLLALNYTCMQVPTDLHGLRFWASNALLVNNSQPEWFF